MNVRLRTLACAGLAVMGLGLASGVAWAGPGQNPTPADCAAPPAGSPCIVVSGTSNHAAIPARVGDTVGYTFTLTNSGDADGTALDMVLHLDVNLELDRSSVRVNGNPVTVGSAGTDPDVEGPFPVPAHGADTLTFSATVLPPFSGAPAPMTTWVDVSGLQTSNDVVVSPPAIDMSISNGTSSPTNEVAGNPVQGATIDVAIDNHGTTPRASTITVPIPAGWSLTPPTDDPDVSCSAAGAVETCDLAAFPLDVERGVQFVLTPGPSVPVGSLTPLTITLTPSGGVDEFPSDNAVTFQLRNVGAADLHITVSQDRTTVSRHGLVHFAVTVTNAGPNPAVGLDMALWVRTDTANGFTQLKPVGPGQIMEGGGEGLLAGPSYDWQPGTVAAGQTVRLAVTWRAEVAGATGHLETRTSEQPYNASAHGAGFETVPSATVTVARAGSSAGGQGSEGAEGSQGGSLANTGSNASDPLGWGAGLLALGGLLLLAGRRQASR